MSKVRLLSWMLAALWACSSGASAADATFSTANITPEAAIKAAQATLSVCRKKGYQVTVAVTDRAGLPVALLRDRLAGWHTVDIAIGKARTAVSFRTPTGELASSTQAGRSESGIRHSPGVVMVAGGLPIEAAGSVVGGIGVSGAPGGELDEGCAKAGIEAISEDLAF